MTWQPTTFTRFIKGFPSSACTALVDTDAGEGYLKAMGGPEGPHTLAAEVVATQLANWFGLPTFDWAILTLDEIDEIPFLDDDGNQTGMAHPGRAFITRAESGVTWGGSGTELKRIANPQDISRMVVFDTWVLNCDRYSHRREDPIGNPRVNYDNVFLSEDAPDGQFLLKAMDHTHCFTCGRAWKPSLAEIGTIKDDRVFGLFPEFQAFLTRDFVIQAADDLRRIDREIVAEMTQPIPNEWEVTPNARDALVELVVRRANFVADTIVDRLCPTQRELFPDDESEEPEI